jgi:hypothetical protein
VNVDLDSSRKGRDFVQRHISDSDSRHVRFTDSEMRDHHHDYVSHGSEKLVSVSENGSMYRNVNIDVDVRSRNSSATTGSRGLLQRENETSLPPISAHLAPFSDDLFVSRRIQQI